MNQHIYTCKYKVHVKVTDKKSGMLWLNLPFSFLLLNYHTLVLYLLIAQWTTHHFDIMS